MSPSQRLSPYAAISMLATACFGCDRTPSSEPTTRTAEESTASSAPYRATLGGAPLQLQSILATRVGERGVFLRLSPVELDCRQGTEPMPAAPSTPIVDVILMPKLHQDGTSEWRITFVHLLGRHQDVDLGPAKVLSASDGKLVAEIDLTIEGDAGPAKLGGRFEATDCGTRPPAVAVAAQPHGASIRLAGQTFPIGGASLKTRGKAAVLRLSSLGHDCRTSHIGGAVVLELTLEGRPPRVVATTLEGEIFSASHNTGPQDKLSVEPSGSLAGEGTVRVALGGQAESGNYALELGGAVEVARCDGD